MNGGPTSFWVLLKPRAVVRRMIQYHISQVEETILVTGQGENLAHLCDPAILLSDLRVIEHARLVAQLILDRVGRVTFTSFLEGRPV